MNINNYFLFSSFILREIFHLTDFDYLLIRSIYETCAGTFRRRYEILMLYLKVWKTNYFISDLQLIKAIGKEAASS